MLNLAESRQEDTEKIRRDPRKQNGNISFVKMTKKAKRKKIVKARK